VLLDGKTGFETRAHPTTSKGGLMAISYVVCEGPRRMPDPIPEKCPACGTVIPVHRKRYVRHYVKQNGKGTPILGSAVVAPKPPDRGYTLGGKKVKGPKKRRKRKWSS
jgi:hypothetical protein